jgi:hypothetical protein
MMDPLQKCMITLSEFSTNQLDAVAQAVNLSPGLSPGLLAWLENAVDWESNRRVGRTFPLRPPQEAIDDEEMPNAILVLAMLLAQFRGDPRPESAAMASLLQATAEILHADA